MVHMTQDTYLQQGKQKWRQFWADPRLKLGLKILGYGLGGMALSAVSFGKTPQPVSLGLICALTGWRAAAAALGSALGCRIIWGDPGEQGAVWSLGGCALALLLGKRKQAHPTGWLMALAASLLVSVTGLAFQMLLGDQTGVTVYWIRVALAGVATKLFQRLLMAWDVGEPILPRKGEIATAQVKLEIMAGALAQTQQILLEAQLEEIDEDGILARSRERACGGCPNRKGCMEAVKLRKDLLRKSLTDTTSLGIGCKKPNRLLLELRRGQEQLRLLRATVSRRQECREAMVQQYRFLSDYLRQTADDLRNPTQRLKLYYKAEVQIATWGKETANGDRCQAFSGCGGKYYVLLCDGMGTGLGAAQEGQRTLEHLRQMLTAGFPAPHALESLNSMLCLAGRAGSVTVDLAEIYLDSGKVTLYKWGAAASVLIRGNMAEKIGTAGPPPGVCVGKTRETVDRLSLRRGEVLVLMSDGVDGDRGLACGWIGADEPLGEYAAKLLETCSADPSDDATVAAIRLHPTSLYT